MADSFLRLPQVKDLVGFKSNSQIYALIKDGRFPQPVKIGGRAVAWVRAEIENWIAARIAASRPAGSEPMGGNNNTPQSKVPLPISRGRGRAAEEARHE